MSDQFRPIPGDPSAETIPMAQDRRGARPVNLAALRADLAVVLNRHSAENGSNTPDFILADYVLDCLAAFDGAVRNRERWYDRNPDAGPGAGPPAHAAGRLVVALDARGPVILEVDSMIWIGDETRAQALAAGLLVAGGGALTVKALDGEVRYRIAVQDFALRGALCERVTDWPPA